MPGVINKFNRGEISKDAFVRDDYEKVANSCELMRNFMPKRLGAMMFRPGTKYIGDIPNVSYKVPFTAGLDDKAILEFTNETLRIWVNDSLLSRVTTSTTVTNGTFDSDLASWTDASDAGSTAAWYTGGYAALTGTGTGRAVLHQTLSVSSGGEHAVRLVIERGPVLVKLGTSGVNSDDLFSGELLPGTHSLVVSPAGDLTVTLINSNRYMSLVDSVSIESAGVLTLPAPFFESSLSKIRYDQSGDIVYLACDGYPQYQVERRGEKSWSIVPMRANDGPFGSINSSDITLTPNGYTGDITLTASQSYFKPEHVGSLYKIVSYSQRAELHATAVNQTTESILVTGTDRELFYSITTIYNFTIVLEQSADNVAWTIKETQTSTGGSWSYDDEQPNAYLYYRLRVTAVSSGSATLAITYNGGSNEGVVRVTERTSDTVVNAQVLKPLSNLSATRDWYPGEWSDVNGYPSALSFYEQRLWFAGNGSLSGSVSDAWPSYDGSIEGNSRAIQKSIGFGMSKAVRWLASAMKLVIGMPSDEVTVKSNSFSEPLTQDNCNLKKGSNQGAYDVSAERVDDELIFVSRSGKRLFSLSLTANDTYNATDLNLLNDEICEAGIKRIAVSRHPETRIYLVMDDGTARVYIYDPVEEVSGWARLSTEGSYVDVIVLPSQDEDEVYFTAERNGFRYLEKQAAFSEAIDVHSDSAVHFTNTSSVISGLDRFNGMTVNLWADGQDRGNFTVSNGEIIAGTGYADAWVGLPYVADYTSNKLNRYINESVLSVNKRVKNFALIMRNTLLSAISIGRDEDHLVPLPKVVKGRHVTGQTIISDYDNQPFEFNGNTETDPRIHIRATGPCTILALTYEPDEDEQPKAA